MAKSLSCACKNTHRLAHTRTATGISTLGTYQHTYTQNITHHPLFAEGRPKQVVSLKCTRRALCHPHSSRARARSIVTTKYSANTASNIKQPSALLNIRQCVNMCALSMYVCTIANSFWRAFRASRLMAVRIVLLFRWFVRSLAQTKFNSNSFCTAPDLLFSRSHQEFAAPHVAYKAHHKGYMWGVETTKILFVAPWGRRCCFIFECVQLLEAVHKAYVNRGIILFRLVTRFRVLIKNN